MSADGRLIIREEDDDAATTRMEEEEGAKGRAAATLAPHSFTRLFIHSFMTVCWRTAGQNRSKELVSKATCSNSLIFSNFFDHIKKSFNVTPCYIRFFYNSYKTFKIHHFPLPCVVHFVGHYFVMFLSFSFFLEAQTLI